MLEYFHPWPNSAGFFLARDRGWYLNAGLDVELAVYDPARGDSLDYVHRGEAHFAIAPTKRFFVRREQGQPLLGIAAVNNRCHEVIQTVRATGISRPRDLSGKRIGLRKTARGIAIVRHVIAADGGAPDSFEAVDTEHRELRPEDIAAGVVDATFGSYWSWELAMDSMVPHDDRIIWRVDEIGLPRYQSYLLGGHEQTVQRHPGVVRAFLAATALGYAEAMRDPAAVVAVYETVVPYFPRELLLRSLQLASTTWMHGGEWGRQRPDLLAPYAEWLAKKGILANPDIWKTAYSNAFLTPPVGNAVELPVPSSMASVAVPVARCPGRSAMSARCDGCGH
jgi:NitT/TauT family transport system substrate-binding protein